jgi:hypothetical protein
MCHLLMSGDQRPLAADEPLRKLIPPTAQTYVGMPERSFPDVETWPWLATLHTDQPAHSFALGQSVHDALEEAAPANIQRGRGRRNGGWLVSPQPRARIATHLSKLLIQRMPDGHPALVRFTDPAVLWPLCGLLSDRQKALVFGPVKHWWLLDPAGYQVQLDRPADAQEHQDAAASKTSV